MAGEGTKYIKKKTIENCKLLLQNFLAQTQDNSACTVAKIDYSRNKALFPDGTETDVVYVGDTTQHMAICKTSAGKAIAHKQEAIKAVIGGARQQAMVLEQYNNQLYVRKVGSGVKYQVPNALPSQVSPGDYSGGFSSNGKHLFIGGSFVENGGEDVHIYFVIFKNFSLNDSDSGPVFTYKTSESGTYNLREVFDTQIVSQLSAPAAGEANTTGLVGTQRCRYLYNYNAQFETDPTYEYTLEEQLEFINFMIEYFELTPEEVDLLFPPEFFLYLYKATQQDFGVRFNPNIFIEYSSYNNPYTYLFSFQSQALETVTEQYTGHREDTWESITPPKPAFMEFSFAFNNNSDGDPVLDIIASYQTVTIYGKTYNQWETHWPRLVDIFNSMVNFESYEQSKYDREQYLFHSIPEDWLYASNPTISYLRIDPPGGTDNAGLNYYMESKGDRTTLDGEGGQFGAYKRYYPNGWFKFCSPAVGGNGISGCQYWEDTYIRTQTPPSPSLECVLAAGFSIFGGENYFFNLFPPDENDYNYYYFDGTSSLNHWTFGDSTKPPVYPVSTGPAATYFATSYPYYYEPYFHGYFTNEDTVWGGTSAAAQVVQFGRGVMAITNANSVAAYKYIDRPPATSGDYDEIFVGYIGVNGARALLSRETYYQAFAYAPEYTTTTNQIIGLEQPDTFTDIYFIDKGTWPFYYEALKAVNSKAFVQYWHDGGVEYIANIRVDNNPTRVTVPSIKSGAIPSDAGRVIDFVILGNKYA